MNEVTPKQLSVFKNGHDMGIAADISFNKGPVVVEGPPQNERRSHSYWVVVSAPFTPGIGDYSLRNDELKIDIPINPRFVDTVTKKLNDGTELSLYRLHFFER